MTRFVFWRSSWFRQFASRRIVLRSCDLRWRFPCFSWPCARNALAHQSAPKFVIYCFCFIRLKLWPSTASVRQRFLRRSWWSLRLLEHLNQMVIAGFFSSRLALGLSVSCWYHTARSLQYRVRELHVWYQQLLSCFWWRFVHSVHWRSTRGKARALLVDQYCIWSPVCVVGDCMLLDSNEAKWSVCHWNQLVLFQFIRSLKLYVCTGNGLSTSTTSFFFKTSSL